MRATLLISFLLLSLIAHAQQFTISGKVLDAKDNGPLIGVSVLLVDVADANHKSGAITDVDGAFTIAGMTNANYTLTFNYLGYTTVNRNVTVAGSDVAVPNVLMTSAARQLKGVTVSGQQIRAQQSGDTSSFNAGAYKTNPDASAEDLLQKMPGITSENGNVKVNGENVQQVYVDGKPFFGTDPTAAIRNLPAEVIDKIQVFDKLSDQSQFTGFDDGSGQKTINIITRRGKSEGIFGKLYAGYGTDERYIAGGNLNFFNGDRRISLLGLSNNINQQNFSSDDLLGAMSSSGQNRGGGGPRGGGSRGGNGGPGGSGNNFMVGQQNGIATTNSAGFNYSDNWGKKVKVTGSYFFNNSNTINNTNLVRDYFTNHDTSNRYHESYQSDIRNANHRANLRLEYNIDSFNSVIFTPSLSYQSSNNSNTTQASDSIANRLTSNSNISNVANNNGYNAAGNLLIQHKFKKPRRTVSLNLNTALNNKEGNGAYYSQNKFYEPDSTLVRDQQYTLLNSSNTYSGNLTYTEPVGKAGQVMINYNPSLTQSQADKETFNKGLAGAYSDLDPKYSNKYDNTYTTHRGGLSYRVGDRKLNFNIGTNVQYATLDGVQEYPVPFSLNRSFTNVLPYAMLNNKYDDGRNLRIMYRTATNPPSISQLQNVVDVSNPLLLKTGNAALKQDYEHTFIVRYGQAGSKNKNNFFVNLFANYINDYIGNATYIPSRDSLFTDTVSKTSVLINRGAQLSRPVNLDGYVNTRSFFTYGVPIQSIKCNLNFNAGFNYTRTPGLINSSLNYSNNYVPSLGTVLSSNISENIDFALSYTGNYNVIKNTLRPQSDNNYYNHTASARINYIFLKHLVLNTNITQYYYTAFSGAGDQNYLLWNAYIAYKMLKNNALEIRLTAYDILKQNQSISRTVTETYVENSVTQVLQQYFLLQATYTIRHFKGAMPNLTQPDDNKAFRRPEDTTR